MENRHRNCGEHSETGQCRRYDRFGAFHAGPGKNEGQDDGDLSRQSIGPERTRQNACCDSHAATARGGRSAR